MNYLEALRQLQRRDDWERSGSVADASRWDLRRMRSLLSRLGDPQLGRRTIHIAGSKGKGSIAAMIEAALRASGAASGLYTSPHLHRFVERIAVGGEPIAEDEFGRRAGQALAAVDAEDTDGSYGVVSTFETLTAMAFLAFREHHCDYQVLEVGLGGRLDATNVVDAKDVCVIAPIGLEHTAILGDTVPQIAEEKAAIITEGCTVIMAPQRESAADVVRRAAAERDATLIEVAEVCAMQRRAANLDGQQLALRTPRETYTLQVPLLGKHQLDNAATAVLALEALAEKTGLDLAVAKGLQALRWPGRIEVLKRKPLVIADGAHDRDSARRLAQTLRDDLRLTNAVLVAGMSGGKDLDTFAAELAPLASQVIVTRSRNPRAAEPRDVQQAFAVHEAPVAVQGNVGAAMDAALALDEPVVACGSLFVAAEAREHVLGILYDPPLARGARQQESEVRI